MLDPLIVGDESARLHQKLVREDRLAMSVIGAFNFLGNNWDVQGTDALHDARRLPE